MNESKSSVQSWLVVGAGYVGWPLARELARRGVAAYATSRREDRCAEFASDRVRGVRFDVLSPGSSSLPTVDVVAYAVGFDRTAGASMREVYVEGLRRTLERLPKPGRFVYVSSTGVYGDAGGAWVNEDSPTAPSDQGGEVCLEAEGVVRDYGAANAVDWNVCRLAGIYGPGRMIGAEGLRRGEPVAGRPDGWLNLIHRDDAVLALLAVGERGASNRVYNLADDHPTLRREFYRTLAERLRVAEPTFAPERARRHRGDRRVDASRIKRELGLSWLYPSFRDALPELLAPNLPR